MTLRKTHLAIAALFAGLCSGSVQAQDNGWRPFFSVTGAYQGEADLDNGGDFSLYGVGVRGGVAGPLGSGGTRAGLTLNYEYRSYSFSDPVGFGGVAPWGIVQSYGVSVPLSFALRDGWALGVVPSVDWLKENGASTDDSLAWGGIVSAVKRFESGNTIGVGVGVYDLIEDTAVFPFLLIDWRLGERWRLVNPLAAGPTGPAGLELDYEFDGGWTAGVGGAFRTVRFRLSQTGPVPNGVGQERDLPIFLRVTRELGKQMSLHLFAGMVFGGELRVENPSGDLVHEEDFDPAPLFGVTFTARF